jgi:hypothetical protein
MGSFRPHGDFSLASPLTPGGPKLPVRAALRLSQPLDGLILAQPCGLVSCRCHLKGSGPPGGFPFAQRLSLVRKDCPPVVSPPDSPRSQQAGCALPRTSPPSGLCSTPRSVFPVPLLHFPGTRSPHGLCSPTRSSLLLPWSRFRNSSAHGLGLGASAPKSPYPVG